MPLSKPEIIDSRTTPPRFRAGALLVVTFLLGLDLVGLHMAMVQLKWTKPFSFLQVVPELAYFGKWRMFTDTRPTHLVVGAEGWTGTDWTPIDLPTLYPCRWIEGPGYERGGFRRDPERMEAFARHICQRTTKSFERVRLSEVTWPRTPGSVDQPQFDVQSKILVDIGCLP